VIPCTGRDYVARGVAAALPVVVTKNAPVEFWRWEPGAAMQRGLWNIPVPAERRVVVPEVLVIPLVGYDAAGYRLGYGGGYYDRTLAALTPRRSAAAWGTTTPSSPRSARNRTTSQ
jgi:5-formyltetrahydrofolate cyclo-ligase